MPNNPQQPNIADDFSDFDFDENDVLVKDGQQEVKKSKNQEIKKTINQEIKTVESGYVNQSKTLANRSLIKRQIGAPLKLKTMGKPDAAENVRKNLIRQANMQKAKIEAIGREGNGLVYDEKDDEEIEKFKKNSLTKSGCNIDFLVRNLMNQLNIVSTLKIDLIKRLKNIIDSFFRDIRTARATEELLQRSLSNGGLNLPLESARQIMDFISNEYKKIHFTVLTAADNNISTLKENDLPESSKTESPKVEPPKVESPKVKPHKVEPPKVEPPKVESPKVKLLKAESLEKKLIESPKMELLGEGVEAISKKTAKEAQVGIFSDEIANLRVIEISAPKNVKKLSSGNAVVNNSKIEPAKVEPPKAEEQKTTKKEVLFQDFEREEFLKSFDEELTQDENQAKDSDKNKKSWFSRLFRRKPKKSKVRKVQSLKSVESEAENLQLKKEIPHPQPVVRRVVQNKQNFDNRPKVEDVKVVRPHLVGPIEELSEMTVLDFRRLGSTARDSVDKIKDKIEISAKDSFNQKITAINAWRKSQPNQLYVEFGRQSLSQKLSVEDLISQYNLENKPTLTKEEFDLISQLNKELRY
ncbi:MAG: hypothetical protein ABIC82_00065 [bacterium]